MGYRYLIGDLARAEPDAVGGTHISCFAVLGDPARGRAWANRSYAEHRRCVDGLKDNPRRHPTCTVYPFGAADAECRGFRVGWFTALHAIDDPGGTFTVWHIRSSRSGFTKVRQR